MKYRSQFRSLTFRHDRPFNDSKGLYTRDPDFSCGRMGRQAGPTEVAQEVLADLQESPSRLTRQAIYLS